MAEQCIVCLSDLDVDSGSSRLVTACDDDSATPINGLTVSTKYDANDESLIATLRPCMHHLHNLCLVPWVERANSCPICRTSFNLVELSHSIGGPLLSSYPVEDRTQAPEVDDTIPPDHHEDDHDEVIVCAYCGYMEDDEDVLICDSCNRYHHMHCAGVENVPDGDWFCQPCLLEQRASLNRLNTDRPRGRLAGAGGAGRRARRLRTSRPRQQQQPQQQSSSWGAVWQSVWHRLGLDVDSEWIEEEQKSMENHRTLFSQVTQDREFRAWERRLQVAQQQGGRSSRFRETRGALLAATAPQAGSSRPAAAMPSEDEVRAWNDLDKARNLDGVPRGNGGRKRKPTSESPVEPPTPEEPVRKFKRPMTRRAPELTRPRAESSTAVQAARTDETHHHHQHSSPTVSDNRGSTFLQSLLEEVEAAGVNETAVGAETSTAVTNDIVPSDRDAPSPALSPTMPVRGRALTAHAPEARRTARSGSPPLTSFVRPVYPTATLSRSDAASSPPALAVRRKSRTSVDHSKNHPPSDDTNAPSRRDSDHSSHRHSSHSSHPDRHRTSHRIPKPSTSSNDQPAPRNHISLSAKADISKMVQVALKPFRRDGRVSDEEYTRINRNVSRTLYELVGDVTDLNESTKKRWEKVAAEHVQQAVDKLGKA